MPKFYIKIPNNHDIGSILYKNGNKYIVHEVKYYGYKSKDTHTCFIAKKLKP